MLKIKLIQKISGLIIVFTFILLNLNTVSAQGQLIRKVDITEKVLSELNVNRSNAGKQLLYKNNTLIYAAQNKNADMFDLNYFNHPRPNGQRLAYFLGKVGYVYTQSSEVLATGYDENEVYKAWTASKSHREAINNSLYCEAGFALEERVINGINTVYITGYVSRPSSGCGKYTIVSKSQSTQNNVVAVKQKVTQPVYTKFYYWYKGKLYFRWIKK